MKVLPTPGVAAKLNVAAKQMRPVRGEIARPRPVPPDCLQARAGVRLLERLEDDALLFRPEYQCRCRSPRRPRRRAPGAARCSPRSILPATAAMRSRTLPWAVNLNALESRFFKICCTRLRRLSCCAVCGSTWISKARSRGLRLVTERPASPFPAGGRWEFPPMSTDSGSRTRSWKDQEYH